MDPEAHPVEEARGAPLRHVLAELRRLRADGAPRVRLTGCQGPLQALVAAELGRAAWCRAPPTPSWWTWCRAARRSTATARWRCSPAPATRALPWSRTPAPSRCAAA